MSNPYGQHHGQSPLDFQSMNQAVSNGLDSFRDLIRRKPGLVLGAAFGIGLLVGIMTTRNRKQDSKPDDHQKQP